MLRMPVQGYGSWFDGEIISREASLKVRVQ